MGEKTVLIQCGDHYENQSRVFLLAKTIQEMGHTPVVLMYTIGKGNLFKINGISVVYMNQFLKRIKDKDIHLDSVVYDELTVKQFVEIEIKRNPRLGWPSQIRRTANMTVRYVDALNQLLDVVRPDSVVVWNGFTGYVANVLRVLTEHRAIPTAFIERGLLKTSLFIDGEGVNGGSSIAKRLPDFSQQMSNDDSDYINKRLIKPQATNIERPAFLQNKKVVFFPLQVQLDTNIILYCPYDTMREVFFREIYATLNAEDTVFVVRPHPEESAETRPNIPLFDNVIVSSDETLDYWLTIADLVVTINSTVGLEALILDKPVVCLGESIYSSVQSVANRPKWHNGGEEQKEDVRRYLFFLLKNNLMVDDNAYNKDIVRNHLSLNTVAKTKQDERMPLLPMDSLSGRTLQVFCDFSFSTKLNLTYREHSLSIDYGWIEQIMEKNFPGFDFEVTADKTIADVVIVDEERDIKTLRQDKRTIDIYGHRLR